MALLSFSSFSITKLRRRSFSIPKLSTNTITSSLATVINMTSDQAKVRRSANYQPTIWNNDFIQSLNTEFSRLYVASMSPRMKELKSAVRKLLHKVENYGEKVELIATLERLGLGYQFEDDIKEILEKIYNDNYVNYTKEMNEDLYTTALQFRILREHGYEVSEEILSTFKVKNGEFKACIEEDIKGILSLYEASFLIEEGESILEDAKLFTTKHLNKFIEKSKGNGYHSILASHALKLPLRWRAVRLEARWFIDVYEKYEHKNLSLLKLAKLNFNYVQAIHQEELKEISRWWSSTGLGQELGFARDRLMEGFFWASAVTFQPDFSYTRITGAKFGQLITTIDDVYDLYGTLDELELFTTAVERWDISALEHLPSYMKCCFLVLYNSINEMGFDILKQQGINVIPYLKNSWVNLCRSYLLEAKWYYNGYTPTLQEYLDNAVISIAAQVIFANAYISIANPIMKDVIETLEEFPPIIKWSAMIVRLADDLGTSSDEVKRGDVAKSIQCYMNENGASESEDREYIYYLIGEAWKKMNNEHRKNGSLLPKILADMAMDLGRMAQYMYRNGDGYSSQDSETKHQIESLLIKAIDID